MLLIYIYKTAKAPTTLLTRTNYIFAPLSKGLSGTIYTTWYNIYIKSGEYIISRSDDGDYRIPINIYWSAKNRAISGPLLRAAAQNWSSSVT